MIEFRRKIKEINDTSHNYTFEMKEKIFKSILKKIDSNIIYIFNGLKEKTLKNILNFDNINRYSISIIYSCLLSPKILRKLCRCSDIFCKEIIEILLFCNNTGFGNKFQKNCNLGLLIEQKSINDVYPLIKTLISKDKAKIIEWLNNLLEANKTITNPYAENNVNDQFILKLTIIFAKLTNSRNYKSIKTLNNKNLENDLFWICYRLYTYSVETSIRHLSFLFDSSSLTSSLCKAFSNSIDNFILRPEIIYFSLKLFYWCCNRKKLPEIQYSSSLILLNRMKGTEIKKYCCEKEIIDGIIKTLDKCELEENIKLSISILIKLRKSFLSHESIEILFNKFINSGLDIFTRIDYIFYLVLVISYNYKDVKEEHMKKFLIVFSKCILKIIELNEEVARSLFVSLIDLYDNTIFTYSIDYNFLSEYIINIIAYGVVKYKNTDDFTLMLEMVKKEKYIYDSFIKYLKENFSNTLINKYFPEFKEDIDKIQIKEDVCLDPITYIEITHPVKLPICNVIIDKSTLLNLRKGKNKNSYINPYTNLEFTFLLK